MVRLERLVVQGFKSFKRKTSIPFTTGFSVITGANGTGKSNVGDAISFVLGKTSSRVLRAKKSQDLIFHGGKKKPPSEWAKVALFFDNSSKTLPFEEDTVSISRKINQKGISTYRLNGRVVTRQQIIDVFSQVGLHPDGHNIIQQGDVTQIVEMDAVERRGIIDEISGIMEYDEKKKKAMKELEIIDGKVKEAEIVLNEKQSVMEKLEKERNAALEYKKLEEDLGKIRAAAIWKAYSGTKENLEAIKKEIGEKEKESKDLEREIQELDNKIKEVEDKLDSLTQNVLKVSSQLEVSQRLIGLRNELERKKDRLGSNNREIERLESFIERVSSVRTNPAVKEVLEFNGVLGTVDTLIKTPGEYRIAFEVAGGGHLQDVVVDSVNTAVRCIKHLKQARTGRARFLPLNKIRIPVKITLPKEAIGWLSDLVKYEPECLPVVNYLFGRTACVRDIDTAKKIKNDGFRIVTLDGDLIETSGAMTGGFYKRKTADTGSYTKQIKDLRKENGVLEEEITRLREEIDILAEKERKTEVKDLDKSRIKIDESLVTLREKRKHVYDKRVVLQEESGNLNIQKAKLEAKFENLALQWEEYKNQDPREFEKLKIVTLKEKEKEAIQRIQEMGPVNLKALKDFEELKHEFDEFREKVYKIIDEKKSIEDTISKIEERRMDTFMKTLNEISRNFNEIYSELTKGDAKLELENLENIESGLLIKASPHGKKLLHIDSMSGGEKTLTAFAFLFAIQRHKPSPFYVLDEADAALDKTNTKRVVDLIRKQAKLVQFIIISHNDTLVREADQIYGVLMEDGESKIIGIKLPAENN